MWREQGKGAPVPERPGTCGGVAVVVSVQGPAGGMLAVGDIQIHAPSLSGHGHAYAIGQRRQSGQHARVARRADRGDPVWPAAAGRGAGGVLARLGAGRWRRGHAGGTGGAAAACGPGAGRRGRARRSGPLRARLGQCRRQRPHGAGGSRSARPAGRARSGMAGAGAYPGGNHAGRLARAGAHRVPGEVQAAAAGPLRDRRSGRCRPGDARDAPPHPCGGELADVCGELLHRPLRRPAPHGPLPVLRGSARSVRGRAGARVRRRGNGQQHDVRAAAPRPAPAGTVGGDPAEAGRDPRPVARAGQPGLAGRAHAPRRPRLRRHRRAELRHARQLCRRGPRAAGVCGPAHPDRAGPQARARGAGASRGGAHARAAARQPRAAGRDHGAQACREAAARAVPHHRARHHLRYPRAFLCRRPRGGGRTDRRAELLHRPGLGRR